MVEAIALASCTTYGTDAPIELPAERPVAERTALSFHVLEAFMVPADDAPDGWEVGPLAPARDPETYTGFFEDTGQVRITAPPGDVHCELEFRYYHAGETASVFLSGITLTLLPGATDGTGALTAVVSSEERGPVRHEFRGEYTAWIWLPLLPIGVVQGFERGFGRADTRPDLIRALVRRLADDGWLDRTPAP